jgi:hypothetical protein
LISFFRDVQNYFNIAKSCIVVLLINPENIKSLSGVNFLLFLFGQRIKSFLTFTVSPQRGP